MRIVMVLAALATLGAAPASGTGEAPAALMSDDMTCHEECTIRCAQLYPNNTTMRNRCTWSCIDQQCGGGPYP